MILKNDLYTVTAKESNGSGATYTVNLNGGHFIFKAHFPGQPIMPGVCIVQMVKELLEDYAGMPLSILKIKNVKFLSVVTPLEETKLLCQLTKVTEESAESSIKAQATLTSGNETKAKVSLVCSFEA